LGPVFQMLDREPDGTGTYGIKIDSDVMNCVNQKLDEEGVVQIEEFKLPSNLRIWATMNPGDQSVNRTDSAFVRRWTVGHVSIDDAFHNSDTYTTNLRNTSLPSPMDNLTWGEFAKTVNEILDNGGILEDDLLGVYFVQPGDLASWSRFYPKVIYHLANNVIPTTRLPLLFKSNVEDNRITVKSIMAECRKGASSPFNFHSDIDEEE